MLIVIEGADGVGKSIISKNVSNKIGAKKLSFPGNKKGSLGRLVYMLHHEPDSLGVNEISATSVQVLHVASHIDAIEREIKPLLECGESVILDRFWWSTLIYGRHHGVEEKSLQIMIELENIHWKEVRPDIVFLIDRPEPFDKKPNNWSNLRTQYRRFATQGDHPYPVEVVENTSSLASAVDRVLSVIERVGDE